MDTSNLRLRESYKTAKKQVKKLIDKVKAITAIVLRRVKETLRPHGTLLKI